MNPIIIDISKGDEMMELSSNAKISLGFITFLEKIELTDKKYNVFFPYDTERLMKDLKIKTAEELDLYEIIKSISNTKKYTFYTEKDKIKAGNIIVKINNRMNANSVNLIGRISNNSKECKLMYPLYNGLIHEHIYLICKDYNGKEGKFHEGAFNAIKEINGIINSLKIKFILKKVEFLEKGENWYSPWVEQHRVIQMTETEKAF